MCILLLALAAHADDAEARELFDAGVEAMLARNWSEAALLLESALEHKDKPACRFNLVITNRELHRPLEVARHAVAFLTRVEGRSHAEEAAEVRTYLNEAQQELVTLQAEGLPLGAQLKIDNAPPRVVDGSRIYELPGPHRLELWLGEHQLESIDIELARGAIQPWPRVRAIREPTANVAPVERAPTRDTPGPAVAHTEASTPHQDAAARPPSASVTKTLAWTLGTLGAATGLAALDTYAYAASRTDELENRDPAEAGYTTLANPYRRSKAAVMPLAFVGGALMASATALVARKPRAALAISITALVLGMAATGVGATLLARTPKTLVADTDLTRPSREAGSLCIGAALPLLTYGVRLQWDLWRQPARER